DPGARDQGVPAGRSDPGRGHPPALVRAPRVPAAGPDRAPDVRPLPVDPGPRHLGAPLMATGKRLGEGPGAATAEAERAGTLPILEVHGGGHSLEPEYKRLPIGPDHILYPVLVGLALFPILLG